MAGRSGFTPGAVPAPLNQNRLGRIVHVELDERTMVRRSARVEHERAVAIYNLQEENTFSPVGSEETEFRLHLSIEESRLNFDIRDGDGAPVDHLALHLPLFRRIVRDYLQICESYYDAIKHLAPSRIEAIDMGRRGLHDEGATLLLARLEGRVDMDFSTARRLFTLICVLHIRG